MEAKVRQELITRAWEKVKEKLYDEKQEEAYWRGELSPSALSSATALSALFLADRNRYGESVERGLSWLTQTQNPDGGWGDTPKSKSNLSTSALVLAGYCIAGRGEAELLRRCRTYIEREGGFDAIPQRYSGDRTFSAPIFATLALAELVEWKRCPQLPFWLSLCPRPLLRAVGLGVVSYALPALIAVGLGRFEQVDSHGPLRSFLGAVSKRGSLRLLDLLTPESGGYLEAVPITSFVAMNLAASGTRSRTLEQNIRFLSSMQGLSGAWRIEKDLCVWLTSLTVSALRAGTEETREWLLARQNISAHPYTGSPPGGWGWTDGSGSVPDADDTAGALIALSLLPDRQRSSSQALLGVEWLLKLQNSDGGIPTFCRGWQELPFDRSCPDITAHTLRAISAWSPFAERRLQARVRRAVERGFAYLKNSQNEDGSWTPLWFGDENAPNEENRVYGASRVLLAYAELGRGGSIEARRAVEYLKSSQNEDGSWGSGGTMEETGVACSALLSLEPWSESLERGLRWLCERVVEGGLDEPTPIGLYFSKLWYYEKLYPAIFGAEALGKARELRDA